MKSLDKSQKKSSKLSTKQTKFILNRNMSLSREESLLSENREFKERTLSATHNNDLDRYSIRKNLISEI